MIWCLIVIGLWTICAMLGIARAIAYSIEKKKNKYGEVHDFLFTAAGTVSIVTLAITLIFLIVGGTEWASHYAHKAELEAFYTTNVQNYADATNMSNNILLQANFAGELGDIGEGLAYQGQSTEVTKAIMEWRDSVNEYNLDLASYKAWRENPWTNWFYYDIDAEPLAIR